MLSHLEIKCCFCNKTIWENWLTLLVGARGITAWGGRTQRNNAPNTMWIELNICSLCVHWRDWLGYLASIGRAALGACCGGANDWASRAEPLPDSAAGEHACREKTEFRQRSALQYNRRLHDHTYRINLGILLYNEAFRYCSTASGERALKICRHPVVSVCFP